MVFNFTEQKELQLCFLKNLVLGGRIENAILKAF